MTEIKLSPNAERVYRYMKDHNIVGEAKMATAEVITHPNLRIPKNQVMNALQELITKGAAKRKAREKSAGYYLVEGVHVKF